VRVSALGFAGVSSAEPEALARFLGDLAGVAPVEDDGVWRLALPDGDVLAVVGEPHERSVSDTILGLSVDDLDATVAALEGRGIVPLGGTGEGGGLRWRKLHAPDGRIVELVERMAAPDQPPGR